MNKIVKIETVEAMKHGGVTLQFVSENGDVYREGIAYVGVSKNPHFARLHGVKGVRVVPQRDIPGITTGTNQVPADAWMEIGAPGVLGGGGVLRELREVRP